MSELVSTKVERWKETKGIVDALFGVPPEQRKALMMELCSDRPELLPDVKWFMGMGGSQGFEPTPLDPRVEGDEIPNLPSDRFEIRRRLGEGAFGDVYEALDRRHDALVAVKSLKRLQPEAIYQFKRGFRALANIRHRNVAQLYELISDGQAWFLTMELLEGVNFLEYVREGVSQPVWNEDPRSHQAAADGANVVARPACNLDRLRQSLLQLAEGICALHRLRILHRDIKPSNVIVTHDHRVVLLDFGFAKELALESELGSMTLVGTPLYMAQELVSGRASEASDWYSVGVMLYQALTGHSPFFGDFLDILIEKREAEPPSPRAFAGDAPEELLTLCSDLLQRDPKDRPSGSEVVRRLGGTLTVATARPSRRIGDTQSALVGRASELEALQDALASVDQRSAVSLHVRGRSGMGKTALIRSFLQELQSSRSDIVVLSGCCHSGESVPYKALDEVVDGLAQYLAHLPLQEADAILPRNADLLARLFPVLGKVKRGQVSPGGTARKITDSRELRRLSFVALRELLARLADRRSVVLFIDDVQWGDLDSRAFLTDLLAPPDPPVLLLLLAYRSEDIGKSPFLSSLLTQQPADTHDQRTVEVGELSLGESTELADRLMAAEGQTDAAMLASTIAHESGGSPFFIHELVHYSKSAPADSSLGDSTARLDDVINGRIGRLPDQARSVLEAVAVAGRPITYSAVREAVADDAPWLEAGDLLVKENLLRTSAEGDVERLVMYHDRIRESIVASMSPEKLRHHHERLARALEAEGADSETLLVHFVAAGIDESAAHHAERAAKAAASALAFERASRLYRMTLQLGRHDRAHESALRRSLGDALSNAGRGRQAAEEYLAAAGAADRLDELELRRRAAEQYLKSGHVAEGLALVRSLFQELHLWFPERPWQVIVSFALRRLRVRMSRLRFVWRDPSTVSPEMLFRVDLCWSAAFGMGLIDTLRACDFEMRFLMLALRAGDPLRFAVALAAEVANSAVPGGRSVARADRLYAQARELGEQLQDPQVLAFATCMRGTMAWLRGDWKTAYEMNESAAEVFRSHPTGVGWELSTAHIISLSGLTMMGEWRELGRRLPSLVKEANDRGDLYASVGLRLMPYSYVVYLAADEPEKARSEIVSALDEWGEEGFHVQHCDAFFGLIDVALYRGDIGGALDLIASQWPRLRRSQLLHMQVTRIFAYALRAKSALAAAAAEPAASPERRRFLSAVQRDLRRLERESMTWSDGWARLLRAGVAAVEGNRDAALRELSIAEESLRANNMPHYLAAARSQRGHLLGGDEGRELAGEAAIWMELQGIQKPERITEMLAPGFAKPRD